MIYICVNNKKYKLKFKTTVIETRLDYINSSKEGTFFINKFKAFDYSNNKFIDLEIKQKDKLIFILNKKEIFLNNFYIEKDNNGWIKIIEKVKDVFALHNEILLEIKDYMVQSLSCFNIFPGCNLRCPYCSQSINQHIPYDDDFIIYKNYIKKDLLITNNNFKNKKIRYMDRCMGDETLMNWDTFINRVDNIIYSDMYNKNQSFEMYTNATIPENIKKLMNWITNKGIKFYKRFELIITVDTLDFNTSLRYNTKELFNKYKKSLEILSKYVNYKNIDIYFNVMYIDNETTLNTVKKLSDLGFKFFKIGFNEREDSKEYIDMYSNKSLELYKNCSDYMTMVKTRNKLDAVYSFRIYELDKLVFEHKFTFLVGYNVVQYFQSHLSRNLEDIVK